MIAAADRDLVDRIVDDGIAGRSGLRFHVPHTDIAAQRHAAKIVMEARLDEGALVALAHRRVVAQRRPRPKCEGAAKGRRIAEVELAVGRRIIGREEAVAGERHDMAKPAQRQRRDCGGDHRLLIGARARRVLAAQLGGGELILLPFAAEIDLEIVVELPIERRLGVVEPVVGGRGAQPDLRQHPAVRVGEVGGAEVEHRCPAARGAVIVAVIVDIILVERQRVLHRVAVLRGRMAADERQRDVLAELLHALERQLLELGVQPVEPVLDAEVDVVEGAGIHHAVADLGADHVRVRDAAARRAVGGGAGAADAERRRFEIALLARALEVRIEGVEADQRPVGRFPLQRPGDADPLLVVIIIILAGEARMLGRIDGTAVAGSRAEGGAAGGVEAAHPADALEAGREARRRRPAHGARPFLDQLALGVGDRQEGAERTVGENVGDEEGAARGHLLRKVVIIALHRGGDGEALIVERPRGAQVDGGAERAFLDRRLGRLAERDCVEEVGRKDVEVERAAAVGAARRVGAAGGGQRFHAVDADAGELRPEAAHRDLAALAAVALEGDARDALDRLGEIEVRELADVLGEDRWRRSPASSC